MATSDADRDDFITPLPDDEGTSPEGVHLRDTPTVEFCPPTPPPVAGMALTFDPGWRTETVIALARGIDADAAYDRLPILADALEEAGCDHPQLLHHCRTCPHPYACCWVVNVVLDRVRGELPPVLSVHSPIPVSPAPRITPRPRLVTRIKSWDGWENAFRVSIFVVVAVCVLLLLTTVTTDTSPPATPRVNTFTEPTGMP